MGKIAYRLKGHESFVPREGWITKGLIAVNNDPAIFADNYAADKRISESRNERNLHGKHGIVQFLCSWWNRISL